MKKNSLIIGISIVVLLLLIGGGVISQYNTIVKLDEQVQEKRAQVENQYQRRADLIPNLVRTVQGFANQEQDVLTAVIDARANATRTSIDISDPQALADFQTSQAAISGSLSRLLAVSESYPELRSNQNFLELQTQLEGTENRISVERMRYNEAVREHNTYIRRFPTVLFARLLGIERAILFEADAGAENPPTVTFE